jgi:hypothetical protein
MLVILRVSPVGLDGLEKRKGEGGSPLGYLCFWCPPVHPSWLSMGGCTLGTYTLHTLPELLVFPPDFTSAQCESYFCSW